jgi:tRNA 2-thiouridine synthesizing protein B
VTRGNIAEPKIKAALGQMRIYALRPDLEARGMQDAVIEGVQLVDYGGFVDLVTGHSAVQSWL